MSISSVVLVAIAILILSVAAAVAMGRVKKLNVKMPAGMELAVDFQEASNEDKALQDKIVDQEENSDGIAINKVDNIVPKSRSNIEDVAIRRLEHQYATHIFRQIRIEQSRYIFDGAFKRDGKVYGIEVKSLIGFKNAQRCLDIVSESYLKFPEKLQRAFVFLLCFVKTSDEGPEVVSATIRRICETEYPFDVVVRIVDACA